MGKLTNFLGGAFTRLKKYFSSTERTDYAQEGRSAPAQAHSTASSEAPIAPETTVHADDIAGTPVPEVPAASHLAPVDDTSREDEQGQRRLNGQGVEEKDSDFPKTTLAGDAQEGRPAVRRRRHEFEFNGETLSVTEWAKRYGVAEATMRYRIAKYHAPTPPGGVECAVRETDPLIADTSNIKIEKTGSKFTIIQDGIPYSTWQFAKKTGIKYTTLIGRVNKSLDPKQVFSGLKYIAGRASRTAAYEGKLWTYNGESHNVAEWASICKVSNATMRLRLNSCGNPYQQDLRRSAYNERRTVKHTWNGHEYSIKQLCEKFGCSESAMRRRMKKYGSPELPADSADGAMSKQDSILHPERSTPFPPFDMNAVSSEGHTETFNDFVRKIRKVMTGPDDNIPLSRSLQLA